MKLPHIFISHASNDTKIATDLAEQLRNAGHHVIVDVLILDLGDNLVRFMNDAIVDAHTIVILWSTSSIEANWQNREIDAALWSEYEANGGKCIVFRLDDARLPPLLGPKVYATLDPSDRDSLKAAIQRICEVAAPGPNPSHLVAKALQRDSQNPFRHLRAEFFEDRPDLHVQAFAQPDGVTVGSLEDMKPCFLEGSRGTGKSMLLLSLRARNRRLREKQMPSGNDVFGFYVKLTRGAICNVGARPDGHVPIDPLLNAQLADLTEQELVLQLLESLLSEIVFCVNESLVTLDGLAESSLAVELFQILLNESVSAPADLDTLLDRLHLAHRDLAQFIRRRFIYSEDVSIPNALLDFRQLDRAIYQIKRYVPDLKDSMFIVLLDEYENLFPYQQRIVNTLVKLGPPALSVKVAKKIGVADTSDTGTGQELQELHDYTRITLVYDVEDTVSRGKYRDLLRRFVANMLACEGLPSTDIDTLLPRNQAAEVDPEELIPEIAQLCKVTVPEFTSWPESRKTEKTSYYREAATYRILQRHRREKRFHGFDDISFVSSGIIRYFQEILGVAFHLNYGPKITHTEGLVICPDNQTKAVHLVSQHSLTTLSRNVEKYGEVLKYFLLDLADCFRHKLLRHTSEPEAGRFTIQDPELLESPNMENLRTLIQIGVREGVFQVRRGMPAFRPKHQSDPQPSEFNIGRIFAPVLGFSPRLRWRTSIGCHHLSRLIEPHKRQAALTGLKSVLVKQTDTGQGSLELGQ